MKVLLLASRGAEANSIAELCQNSFGEVFACHGDWGQPLPEVCRWWEGDLVVSYCSRWIVPENLLRRVTIAAINFHPGPPDYPGIGCLNWALYERARTFGVTCHHMSPTVDAGEIISHRTFSVLETDDVGSLFARTHLHLQSLAFDILTGVAAGIALPRSSASWSGKKRSRAELNELATITADMSRDEVGRRIRATNFGAWKPKIEVGGYSFELKSDQVSSAD